ncbi:thioredoxin family protein [Micromonospora sp. WMMC241]|uniref:TlpA family protein disulfide reductase n=1 Tax=Micromonospora sp. WMMC241 TaxID=3015159 RepID=UPI0022B69E6F|nr:thioredoxin family protein [Micromonospora sp. WMMC241]MCZ7437385.1 thioredoxin family protein [Micromonospora sp. WMMC241]
MQSPNLTGLAVLVAVLAAATAFGWWRRRHDGRLRAVRDRRPAGPDGSTGADGSVAAGTGRSVAAGDVRLAATLAALGVRPGAVTVVQFSAPVCAPCRATRRILDDVTGRLDGVTLLEVGVDEHLDAARALDVWRTPTLLVVDAGGRIVRRATGVPDRDELRTALGSLSAVARG